ncbi:MAG: type II toxin-antitoxin system Phd/YefM family antitoxin [Deltaproteobacteria bacterium]|nr:type II toxin-antitoxin system Phd/YefM family antitoxin [Deltaproteobacteria bacterium]
MEQINLHAAKTHLSKLVDRAAAGEEIILARAGRPVARLVALRPQRAAREPGLLRGQIVIADDFDVPLDSDFSESPTEPR